MLRPGQSAYLDHIHGRCKQDWDVIPPPNKEMVCFVKLNAHIDLGRLNFEDFSFFAKDILPA